MTTNGLFDGPGSGNETEMAGYRAAGEVFGRLALEFYQHSIEMTRHMNGTVCFELKWQIGSNFLSVQKHVCLIQLAGLKHVEPYADLLISQWAAELGETAGKIDYNKTARETS